MPGHRWLSGGFRREAVCEVDDLQFRFADGLLCASDLRQVLGLTPVEQCRLALEREKPGFALESPSEQSVHVGSLFGDQLDLTLFRSHLCLKPSDLRSELLNLLLQYLAPADEAAATRVKNLLLTSQDLGHAGIVALACQLRREANSRVAFALGDQARFVALRDWYRLRTAS